MLAICDFAAFELVRRSMFHSFISVWIFCIISVVCQEGSYKSGDMKTCQTCDAGKEPNRDKTACGEIILLRAM